MSTGLIDTYIGAYILGQTMPARRKGRRLSTARIRPAEDLIASYGSGGVGARLRRLSERLDRDARLVYIHAGLKFEQRWVGILILLIERKAATVGELADALAITQPSVSQSLRSLQAAKLVASERDPHDPRLRIQRLTKAGWALIEKARPIWEALIEVAQELDELGIDMITPLSQIERELDKESLFERAIRHLGAPDGRARTG